jgi:hypothetical protein
MPEAVRMSVKHAEAPFSATADGTSYDSVSLDRDCHTAHELSSRP